MNLNRHLLEIMSNEKSNFKTCGYRWASLKSHTLQTWIEMHNGNKVITWACWPHQKNVTFLKFHFIIISSISFVVKCISCRPSSHKQNKRYKGSWYLHVIKRKTQMFDTCWKDRCKTDAQKERAKLLEELWWNWIPDFTFSSLFSLPNTTIQYSVSFLWLITSQVPKTRLCRIKTTKMLWPKYRYQDVCVCLGSCLKSLIIMLAT